MKVLVLHQHFNTPYTGGAIRSYYLAKALAEAGVEVTVLTGYNGNQHKTECVDGFTVHYLPVTYHNRFGFYARSLSFMRFVWGIIRMGRDLRKFDVCYAISVPLTVGIPAIYLKWRYGIPFVFEVGDLWPEAPVQMGFIKNGVLKKILFRLELTIYQNASAIVALSTSIASAIGKKLRGKKIHLVPNMSDTDFFKPQAKDHALQRKFQVDQKFVISYLGAIGLANGLENFLACAEACEQNSLPIHFILCGEGGMLSRIREEAAKLNLAHLTIIPFQNREGVKEIMEVTDAAFISYKPVPILETGSPNKYFDALAAGKLIIVNFGGWIKEEIEREGCGFYIDPNSPETFPKKISSFLFSEKLLKQYQQNARILAETTYSRSLLSDRFVKIFNEFSKPKATPSEEK